MQYVNDESESGQAIISPLKMICFIHPSSSSPITGPTDRLVKDVSFHASKIKGRIGR